MIERYENALQITVLSIGILIATHRGIRQKSRAWALLTLFYVSLLMGDLYWVLSLVFFGDTPKISLSSDWNWVSAYLFLYLLLRQTAPPPQAREKRLTPWLGFVFALSMSVFFFSQYIYWNVHDGAHYVLWARALSNLLYGMIMGLLLFSAIRRLAYVGTYPRQKALSLAILFFCLVEYGLWTVSCFEWKDGLANPYYWFDFLMTVSTCLLLPATRRAVTE